MALPSSPFPADKQVILLPCALASSALPVLGTDLAAVDEPFLVQYSRLLFPPKPSLDSHPIGVIGLFGVRVRQLAAPEPTQKQLRNGFLWSLWRIEKGGDVVLMLCEVALDPEKHTFVWDWPRMICNHLTPEVLLDYDQLRKLGSPASRFCDVALSTPLYTLPLRKYLAPYPIPTPEDKWPHANWPPKKATNELCVQLKLTPVHAAATSRDIGYDMVQYAEQERMFYTKLELSQKREDGVTEIQEKVYFAQNGPFRTKDASEVAACVAFLTEYHNAHLCNTDPDLYDVAVTLMDQESTTSLITPANGGDSDPLYPEVPVAAVDPKSFEPTSAPEVAEEGLASSSMPSSTSSLGQTPSEIPHEIKKPALAIWEALPSDKKVDYFGQGQIVKGIIKEGSGRYLGVSCTVRAWVSILKVEDDDLHTIDSSRWETVTVGDYTQLGHVLPLVSLASMRLGEAAYFVMDPSILPDNSPVVLVAVYLPEEPVLNPNVKMPTHASASTPLADRISFCQALHKDAKLLYERGFFKLALDHYQLGLRELSIRNLLFLDRSNHLVADIDWSLPGHADLKDVFIKNRLNCASCCLYMKEWPRHVQAWRVGDSPWEEGVLACSAILRLEPTHFVALRRRLLLYIDANKFEEASRDLEAALALPEANTAEGKKLLEYAKAKLTQRRVRAEKESSSFARRAFQ